MDYCTLHTHKLHQIMITNCPVSEARASTITKGCDMVKDPA